MIRARSGFVKNGDEFTAVSSIAFSNWPCAEIKTPITKKIPATSNPKTAAGSSACESPRLPASRTKLRNPAAAPSTFTARPTLLGKRATRYASTYLLERNAVAGASGISRECLSKRHYPHLFGEISRTAVWPLTLTGLGKIQPAEKFGRRILRYGMQDKRKRGRSIIACVAIANSWRAKSRRFLRHESACTVQTVGSGFRPADSSCRIDTMFMLSDGAKERQCKEQRNDGDNTENQNECELLNQCPSVKARTACN